MAIEFVDLPSYKMGGFSHQFFVCLPEGTPKIQHGTDSKHMADEFPNMENDHGDLGEVSWYLSLMGKISDFFIRKIKTTRLKTHIWGPRWIGAWLRLWEKIKMKK